MRPIGGPGMGSVDWYAGTSRAALDYEACKSMANSFDAAMAYAEQYPTLGSAEAAGFRSTFAFIPGMGTHHGLDSISPELLADPSFDRHNPVIPDSIIDETFDPDQPEFLQYNGNGPNAVLVGMSYHVRITDGLPPEGFPGNNPDAPLHPIRRRHLRHDRPPATTPGCRAPWPPPATPSTNTRPDDLPRAVWELFVR